MKLHRFFGDFSFATARIQSADLTLIHQLKNVLRIEIGEEIILCDGRGREAVATLTRLDKNEAEFEVVKLHKNENEPARAITLYCAILKRENFEWVAQKATEIGVKKIVPIRTAHTVKLDLHEERIQKIIKEAAEQSGRGIIPELVSITEFSDAVAHSKENDVNIIFDAAGSVLNAGKIKKNSIGIFIGPEGGWSEMELAEAKKAKFSMMSLGDLTLRSETAAIVSAYTILYG